MDNTYDKVLDSIIDSVQFIKRVDNDKEMADAYVDSYMTKQQRLRDKRVTELLELYVSGYKYKNQSNKWYKGLLLLCSCSILIAFTVVFIILIFNMDFSNDAVSVTSMVEVISVCITFLSLIVGILTIIVKYVFPENEEEYITRIVEIIQNNDLENKKENIRAQTKSLQEDEEKKKIIEAIKEL
ncbi:MAG: hypothetical protein IKC46_08805 [Lachnospiraceae bacterium]|nr:hypothetical protein [Lachnospiraceae bacterium]